MIKKNKRSAEEQNGEDTVAKKVKNTVPEQANLKTEKHVVLKKGNNKDNAPGKVKSFSKPSNPKDWNEFKKKKKEVRAKRKEGKSLHEVMVKAKKIGENLRLKNLKGGKEERAKLTEELHDLMGGQGHYPKLVMTHDMSRIVQYMIMFGSPQIRKEIASELNSVIVEMLKSKYAKYCVKRLLKNGDAGIRSAIIKACYGSAVKLASHAVSAAVFDYGFSTWATPLQKVHLVQEFYGDMFKQSKDDSVKHLKDVFVSSPDMKTAALGAVKANLQRILNKQLLDSHIVQTVILQFLQECSKEERSELISQLAPHIVVLSNSKEGSRAAMMCFWHGSNKDRKVCIKTLKDHILALSMHEHGYCTVITIIDSTDDTVLLNKALLGEITSNALDLANDDWGRKVLLWLLSPGDPSHFHPTFVSEINEGRENSTSKKDLAIRRKDIQGYVQESILKQISAEPSKWLANTSVAVITLAILKAGSGDELKAAFEAIANQICDTNWTVKADDKYLFCMEHAGLHMVLKKLVQNDKTAKENNRAEFGAAVVEALNDDILKKWIPVNRACFLLINIIDCDSEEVSNKLKKLLIPHLEQLKAIKWPGTKILVKKLT